MMDVRFCVHLSVGAMKIAQRFSAGTGYDKGAKSARDERRYSIVPSGITRMIAPHPSTRAVELLKNVDFRVFYRRPAVTCF
jgi:hypothetical protein